MSAENFEFDEHAQRESNKISLDSYVFNKENIFDDSIDLLIEDLKKKHSEVRNTTKNLEDKNLSEQVVKDILDVVGDRSDAYYSFCERFYQEQHYIQSQLLSLNEMKIIYAFKSLEIHIYFLLNAAFNLKDRKFDKWENVSTFLKDKNINITTLKGYQEITQLRQINNSIKHSNKITGKHEGIKEFKNQNFFTFRSLELFYRRIQEYPLIFLGQLTSAIYMELYEFDDDKLDKLAKSLILRMDDKTAATFADKLKSAYDV